MRSPQLSVFFFFLPLYFNLVSLVFFGPSSWRLVDGCEIYLGPDLAHFRSDASSF